MMSVVLSTWTKSSVITITFWPGPLPDNLNGDILPLENKKTKRYSDPKASYRIPRAFYGTLIP